MARAKILTSILESALTEAVFIVEQREKEHGNLFHSGYRDVITEARDSLRRGEGLEITDQEKPLPENVGDLIERQSAKITGYQFIIDELLTTLEIVGEKLPTQAATLLLSRIPMIRQRLENLKLRS